MRKSKIKTLAQLAPKQRDSGRESTLGKRLNDIQNAGTASQRILAEYLLRNPLRVVVQSIEELAEVTGFSTATLSRFARSLGYAGYSEMRAAVAESLEHRETPISSFKERFESTNSGNLPTDTARDLKAMSDFVASSRFTERLDRFATLISGASHIYIAGFGLSAHVAGMLAIGMEPYHPAVRCVVDFGGAEIAAGRLMRLQPGDLLIAITLPRYSRDIVSLVEFARDRGATVLAITDGPASPVSRIANEIVSVPCAHPVLTSSVVATTVLVEMIVARLVLASPSNVEDSVQLAAAINTHLHQPL